MLYTYNHSCNTLNLYCFAMKKIVLMLAAISAVGLISSCTGGVSGSCNTPNQRASDGSRCGGRAASVRSGGR
jgi:hypothetical protein